MPNTDQIARLTGRQFELGGSGAQRSLDQQSQIRCHCPRSNGDSQTSSMKRLQMEQTRE